MSIFATKIRTMFHLGFLSTNIAYLVILAVFYFTFFGAKLQKNKNIMSDETSISLIEKINFVQISDSKVASYCNYFQNVILKNQNFKNKILHKQIFKEFFLEHRKIKQFFYSTFISRPPPKNI